MTKYLKSIINYIKSFLCSFFKKSDCYNIDERNILYIDINSTTEEKHKSWLIHSCLDRENEIFKQSSDLNFPLVLGDIVNNYCVPEFKKNDTIFDTIPLVNRRLPLQIIYGRPTDQNANNTINSLKNENYQNNNICSIIKYKNNILITGSFSGLICLWDMHSGKCIKVLESLKIHFKLKKIDKTLSLSMHLISSNDHMIISYLSTGHKKTANNICILSIDQDDICEIFDNDDEDFIVDSLIKISLNKFATLSCDTVRVWNIEDNFKKEEPSDHKSNIKSYQKDIKCISKKTYDLLIFSVNVSSDENKLIIFGRNDMFLPFTKTYKIITMDSSTQEKIDRFDFNEERMLMRSFMIENELLVVAINGTICYKLINCDTFKQTILNIKQIILYAFHLKKDIIAIIATKYKKGNCNNAKINIMHLPTQYCAQVIDLDNSSKHSIQAITNYNDGFSIVSNLSQISTYGYI